MKIWHLGFLTVAALLVATALSSAVPKEAEPRDRLPSPPVIYSGPLNSVYWLEHGTTARGYALAGHENAAPQSVSVIGGIAESITGGVH